ncbi:hypothetical protein PIB30_066152, partial [Stylosanthes scabra]|nr:hypothetical protein [Stylosanthes scabra]
MASLTSWFWFLHKEVVLLLLLLYVAAAASSDGPPRRCYNTIYSFGDSLADTGNLYYDPNIDSVPPKQILVLNPPYGETFFHHPTGRWSNGRVIIDFIAEEMGIPLLQPYLGIKNKKIKDWKATEGVNFAVGGATALTSRFQCDQGIVNINNIVTNYTLPVQLHWFIHEFLPFIHNSSHL